MKDHGSLGYLHKQDHPHSLYVYNLHLIYLAILNPPLGMEQGQQIRTCRPRDLV